MRFRKVWRLDLKGGFKERVRMLAVVLRMNLEGEVTLLGRLGRCEQEVWSLGLKRVGSGRVTVGARMDQET